MDLIFIIFGYLGTFFLVSSYIPQVIKIYKNDNSKVSKKFVILQILTCISFIVYSAGFFTVNSLDGLPIFISNIIVLICLILIQGKDYCKKEEIIENKN